MKTVFYIKQKRNIFVKSIREPMTHSHATQNSGRPWADYAICAPVHKHTVKILRHSVTLDITTIGELRKVKLK